MMIKMVVWWLNCFAYYHHMVGFNTFTLESNGQMHIQYVSYDGSMLHEARISA